MIQVVALGDADFAWLARGPDSGLGLTLPPGGVEAAPVLEMLRGLAAGLRPSVDPCAWALVEAGEVAGLCSVVAPPADGAADIGYGVAAKHFAITSFVSRLRVSEPIFFLNLVAFDFAERVRSIPPTDGRM